MEATCRFTETITPAAAPQLFRSAVAFIDEKKHVLHRYQSALMRAGFSNIYFLDPNDDITHLVNNRRVELVFIEMISDGIPAKGFELLAAMRERG